MTTTFSGISSGRGYVATLISLTYWGRLGQQGYVANLSLPHCGPLRVQRFCSHFDSPPSEGSKDSKGVGRNQSGYITLANVQNGS